MRNATVTGIRAALKARGFEVLNAADTRKFTDAWEAGYEGDVLPTDFPVTEHEIIVTVTEDKARVHAYGRTVTYDANRVRITVYSGRFPDATNHASQIRLALSDYAQSYYYGPLGDVFEPDGAFYTVCYTVDENYWDTVAEIITDRTDVCARDPYTGQHWHAPSNPYGNTCPGHWTRFRNVPTGDVYTVNGGTGSTVYLREASTGARLDIPHYVFRNVFTPETDNATEGQPETAVITSTSQDTDTVWHDFREASDYRRNPTVHSEFAANRYAAVRGALINSGFPTPHPTVITGVSTGTVSMGGSAAVLSIIATSTNIGARAVIGYVWVTTTTDGGMILNVRENVNTTHHIAAIRDTLNAHGWHTVPLTRTGHYSYRLVRHDTRTPEPSPEPLTSWERELLDGAGEAPIMTPATIRDDAIQAEFACATVTHTEPGTQQLVIGYADGTYSLETVCARCARYYIMYAGKVDTHTFAMPVPAEHATLNVSSQTTGDGPLTVSVWPVETHDASNGRTRYPGSVDRTRYGYMIQAGEDATIVHAGDDTEAPSYRDVVSVAFAVADFVSDSEGHAQYATRETLLTHGSGNCPEHGVPYSVCATERPVHEHAERLGNWASEMREFHAAITEGDHERVTELAGEYGVQPERAIENYLAMINPSDGTGTRL